MDDKLIFDGLAHISMSPTETIRDYFYQLNKRVDIIPEYTRAIPAKWTTGQCQQQLYGGKPHHWGHNCMEFHSKFFLLDLFRAGLPQEICWVISLQNFKLLKRWSPPRPGPMIAKRPTPLSLSYQRGSQLSKGRYLAKRTKHKTSTRTTKSKISGQNKTTRATKTRHRVTTPKEMGKLVSIAKFKPSTTWLLQGVPGHWRTPFLACQG